MQFTVTHQIIAAPPRRIGVWLPASRIVIPMAVIIPIPGDNKLDNEKEGIVFVPSISSQKFILMKKLMLALIYTLVYYTSFCQKQTVDTSAENLILLYKLAGQDNIGKKIADFSAFSIHGKKFTSDDFKNKITFVNVWFEACAPCLSEIEALNNLYEKYRCKKDFQFMSFTFETIETAKRLVKERNLKFPICLISLDSIKILNFGQGFPVSMIVNKEGKIIVFSAGGPTDPKIAQEKFNILFKPTLDLLLE